MLKRLLFFCLTLLFFISATSNVSADNKIIRQKTVRNATITAGNRLTVFARGKTLNSKIMDGGIEDVFVGAVSQNAKVFKGGRLWLAGGKSYGAVVHNGGLMEVREHDNKSSYSTDTKLLSGGRMNVFNHSLSEKITVESNGFLRVYFPGAVISDVTILSGGLVHVWKHGTAQNVYVAPGGVLELREESPVLKGTIRVAGQLKVSFDHDPEVSQAEIILDLTKRRVSDVYYIENLDFLKNANISVNIAHNQKTGSYKIASGATKWNDKLDITVNGRNVQSIRLWKPVKIAGKYYTLNRINYKFIELTVSLEPPVSDEHVPELEISQKHKDIFKSYGLEIIAENYSVSPSGRRFTQQELDKDVESMIKDLKLLGKKCVMMSRSRKVIIHGSMQGGANQSGDRLNFAPGASGAFRHEFNHNFEPFGLAYHFWCKLNNKRFVYRHGTHCLPYREILNATSNADEFADDFERKYGQETIHEDITTIFAAATHPKSAAKCLEKSRRSPAYRKKLYLLIASYLEVTGWGFWDQFLNFTPEEKKQIEDSYIDVAKERGLKIYYTRNSPRRYSYQRLMTMWFMDISPTMIKASGIKNIKFFKQPSPPKWNKNTLTFYDDDPWGMMKTFFLACYRRYPNLVKNHLKNRRSPEGWAELFQWCATKESMRYVARQSSKNPVLHQDVICLQNFTSAWMQPEFWEEYNWFYSEYKKDQQYLKTFEKYGIKFSNILPHSVQGEQCPSQEFEQAKHLFIAGTSILTSDFMKKCNIQSVVFCKRLKINGQPVPNGILYIDGVMYIDQSSRLMMRNIFRQLYIINTKNFPEYMKAHIFAETFADLLWNSYRAYKRAKTDNDFYEKVKIIMDLNILRPHAYKTMNLNRIIECR